MPAKTTMLHVRVDDQLKAVSSQRLSHSMEIIGGSAFSVRLRLIRLKPQISMLSPSTWA